MFDATDILRLASQDYILGNTTLPEQTAFIQDQIAKPFDSGDMNYLKRLRRTITDADEMDELCQKLLVNIQDVYPNLKIDVSEYEQRLYPFFKDVYKFFVRKASRLMYIFIREYIFTPKNRKGLVDEFSNIKLPAYPKEQYGKREFYILVTKIEQIVENIFEDDIKLSKFIRYIKRSNDCPIWIDEIDSYIERGYITDNGVVDDMFKLFKDSDAYKPMLNKLEMDIHRSIILPYMKENGMMDVRIPPVEDEEPLDEDDEEDEDGD